MSFARIVGWGAAAVVTLATGVAAGASVQAQHGSTTLSRQVDPATGDLDYSVTFTGGIAGHGWTYTGVLTGTGQTSGTQTALSSTPPLSVTSSDGTISGRCFASSDTADQATTNAVLELVFTCVLSRSGSTPWEVRLPAVLKQAAGADTWTGPYAEAQASAPALPTGSTLSYGEAQLGEYTAGGSIQFSPLRLSGHIAIGAVVYNGDLVGVTNAFTSGADMPPLTMSGSSGGQQVSGTCNGTPDSTLATVTDEAFDFTCSLTIGSAAPATVTLLAVLPNHVAGCSFRECWSDESGTFTSH